MRKRVKIQFGPPVEFQGEIAQAFNLRQQETGDGWHQAEVLARQDADRARAEALQVDMFPDSENPAPTRHYAQRRD